MDTPNPTAPSGRQRILTAAIDCFAADGTDGTSLKRVAERAGVSPALVVHHFGSKAGLREACDHEVFDAISAQIQLAIDEGAQLDVLEAFRRRQEGQASALPYLARALSEGGPSVVQLVDKLAETSVAATDENVANGLFRPSDHQRERALVLLIWSLGAVALHHHVERLLGADLIGAPRDVVPYLRGATEMLGDGLFTPEMRDRAHDAITQLERETS